MNTGAAEVAWARGWIGTNGYTEGHSHRFGEGVDRGDCSSFCNAAFHHATGKYIAGPDSWTGSQMDAFKAMKLWLPGSAWKQAQPGDFIYYTGHVALYEGNGKVISNGSDPIKEHAADYRPVIGVGRASAVGAKPVPLTPSLTPGDPTYHTKAVIRHDTPLYPDAHLTAAQEGVTAVSGGSVHVANVNSVRTVAHVQWGGHDGFIAYKNMRWV
jgi:cell wall-associated NlpC family hydrolase